MNPTAIFFIVIVVLAVIACVIIVKLLVDDSDKAKHKSSEKQKVKNSTHQPAHPPQTLRKKHEEGLYGEEILMQDKIDTQK